MKSSHFALFRRILFIDSEIWTAIHKTSQLTLTPNSASKRRIQWLWKSSLSSENPPYSYFTKRSREV